MSKFGSMMVFLLNTGNSGYQFYNDYSPSDLLYKIIRNIEKNKY